MVTQTKQNKTKPKKSGMKRPNRSWQRARGKEGELQRVKVVLCMCVCTCVCAGVRRKVNINNHNTTLRIVNFLIANKAICRFLTMTTKSNSIFSSFFSPSHSHYQSFFTPFNIGNFPPHKNPQQGSKHHVSSAKQRCNAFEL